MPKATYCDCIPGGNKTGYHPHLNKVHGIYFQDHEDTRAINHFFNSKEEYNKLNQEVHTFNLNGEVYENVTREKLETLIEDLEDLALDVERKIFHAGQDVTSPKGCPQQFNRDLCLGQAFFPVSMNDTLLDQYSWIILTRARYADAVLYYCEYLMNRLSDITLEYLSFDPIKEGQGSIYTIPQARHIIIKRSYNK